MTTLTPATHAHVPATAEHAGTPAARHAAGVDVRPYLTPVIAGGTILGIAVEFTAGHPEGVPVVGLVGLGLAYAVERLLFHRQPGACHVHIECCEVCGHNPLPHNFRGPVRVDVEVLVEPEDVEIVDIVEIGDPEEISADRSDVPAETLIEQPATARTPPVPRL